MDCNGMKSITSSYIVHLHQRAADQANNDKYKQTHVITRLVGDVNVAEVTTCQYGLKAQ